MTDVAIVCGGYDWAARRVVLCPTENKRRRFVVLGAHWYGAEWLCLGCGDRWSEDGRGERPFRRAWRQEAIARAKRWWSDVPLMPTRAQAMTELMEDFNRA